MRAHAHSEIANINEINYAHAFHIISFTHMRACVNFVREYSEIRGSISQPLEPLQPKSLYVRNLLIEPVNIRQGVGAFGRVWGHVAGSEVVVGGQAYSIDGDMWQKWDGVVGCEGMWQGVGECGRGGGRVWGHVAAVGVCSRGSGYGMDGDMWWGWGHVVGCRGMWQGVGACGRGVAGCGGMWQGLGIW